MAETRDWASGLHSIGEGSADQAMTEYGYATPASIEAAIQQGIGVVVEGMPTLTAAQAALADAQQALADVGPAAAAAAAPAVTAAQQSADSAAESALLAQQAQAAALEVPDANVSALVGNPTTDTRAALDAYTSSIRQRTALVDDYWQSGDIDDGPSFRRAAAANDRVQLGPREYLVTPTTLASGLRQCVPMGHGVAWLGAGRDATTVKVGPSAGNYHAIFGPDTGNSDPNASIMADLSGLSLSGLTIDQNATDNPVTSYATQLQASGSIRRGRVGVVAFAGTGVTVADTRFTDFHSIWCVQLLGQNLHRTSVRNSEFVGIGHTSVNWDHTSIYLDNGGGGTVEGCTFEARAHAARQPFELHGSRMTARGNLVNGYVYGMDVTGSTWHGPGSGVASGNQFLGVASGLDIWTGPNYGVVGQYGIDGFQYVNNVVTTDHARWGGAWYVGMVTLNGGASLPIRGLSVTDNTYRLLTLGTPASLDQYSQVVSLARSGAASPVTGGNNHDVDITIARNTAIGSVAGFMRYVHPGAGIDGLNVVDNVVRNVGQGGTAAYDSSRNAALLMETSTISRVRHQRNTYTDTATPRGINRGSYYVAPTISSVIDDGSRITTADGVGISLSTTTATTGAITLAGSAPKFTSTAHTARFTGGSLMVDESTGKTWRQSATGPGAWVEVV